MNTMYMDLLIKSALKYNVTFSFFLNSVGKKVQAIKMPYLSQIPKLYNPYTFIMLVKIEKYSF